MLRNFLFSLILVFSISASWAGELREGVVRLANGELNYLKIAVGNPRKPTVVLLNGIVYGLDKFDPVVKKLAENDFTVLIYALPGQPENLKLLKKGQEPVVFKEGVTVESLAEHLHEILDLTGLGRRQVVLAGASYGSAISAEFNRRYPDQVRSLVMAVPMIVSLDTYQAPGQMLRTWFDSIRLYEDATEYWRNLFFPGFGKLPVRTSSMMYDLIYGGFIGQGVKKVPAGVDAAQYKRGIFLLMRAVKDFDLNVYRRELPQVHYLVAGADDKNLLADQEEFWNRLPASSKRSFLKIRGSSHFVVESSPHVVSDWILRVLSRRGSSSKPVIEEIESEGLPVEFFQK